jgi:hypothetical protein
VNIYDSPEMTTLPKTQTEIECGECLRKMSVFAGTNCLVCECGELRWLV